MSSGSAILLLFTTLVCTYADSTGVSLYGFLSSYDKEHIKNIFDKNFLNDAKDAKTTHYISLGYTSLGVEIPKKSEACSVLKNTLGDSSESIYHSSMGSMLLGKGLCQLPAKKITDVAAAKLINGAQMMDIFYLTLSMKAIDAKIDKKLIKRLVDEALTKDKSAASLAYMFHIVANLNLNKNELKPYLEYINEVLQQADEFNKDQLYYDNGLYTTTMVAQGIHKIIDAYEEAPPNVETSLVKMLNYFYARRGTNNLRAAATLMDTLKIFATSRIFTPLVLVASKQPNVQTERFLTSIEVPRSKPEVSLMLVDVLGEKWYTSKEINLKAGGLYSHPPMGEPELVGAASRGVFAGDGDTFKLTLDTDLPRGYYMLAVNAQLIQGNVTKHVSGASNTRVPLRIVADAKVAEATLTLMDVENYRHIADIKLPPQQRYKATGTKNGAIKLESGQQFAFHLKLAEDASKVNSLTAHQVFLQLVHSETEQRITFTCEHVSATGPENAGNKLYQLTLNPSASAADFDYLSGVYRAELIVGDSLLKEPLLWHMVDFELSFTEQAGADTMKRVSQAVDTSKTHSTTAAASKRASGKRNPIIGDGPTSIKPELAHSFRTPDRRAPRMLAYIFTAICALPLLCLLIAWIALRVNISNFQCSLSALVFHLGLIGIFILYGVYWYCLDMFTTLRYLAVIGVPTFIAGNAVLRAQLTARHQAIAAVSAPSKHKKNN